MECFVNVLPVALKHAFILQFYNVFVKHNSNKNKSKESTYSSIMYSPMPIFSLQNDNLKKYFFK